MFPDVYFWKSLKPRIIVLKQFIGCNIHTPENSNDIFPFAILKYMDSFLVDCPASHVSFRWGGNLWNLPWDSTMGFKVTFLTPSWRSLKLWRGHVFHHPKKVTKTCQLVNMKPKTLKSQEKHVLNSHVDSTHAWFHSFVRMRGCFLCIHIHVSIIYPLNYPVLYVNRPALLECLAAYLVIFFGSEWQWP